MLHYRTQYREAPVARLKDKVPLVQGRVALRIQFDQETDVWRRRFIAEHGDLNVIDPVGQLTVTL
ncbi:hypothetical protein BK022_07005 [Methylorubrum extorquens]|uniref:Uncharacterized protein n=1 Tax=Methylorubrum extorquens TaxID=408 RepID=A0A1S1P7U7_METEX|nr:hypothetical protein BK022_07005 [Methylorubrum extorquens]